MELSQQTRLGEDITTPAADANEIQVQFIPLKKDYKTMKATLPVSWNGFQTKFFFQKFHDDNNNVNFPKKPKFFIHGKQLVDYKRIETYVTEVRFSKSLSNFSVGEEFRNFENFCWE